MNNIKLKEVAIEHSKRYSSETYRDGNCTVIPSYIARNSFVSGAKWQVKQSPWISVEERLPEYTQYDKKRYVAKVEYGSMIKEYQTAIVWMQNKFKFNIEMDFVKVTHWMEIPE